MRRFASQLALFSAAALFNGACGGSGPDARSLRVEFDLLPATCSDGASCGDHAQGLGVIAKSGDETSDGFVPGPGLRIFHAEAETASHGTAMIDIVIPEKEPARFQYRELIDGKPTFRGSAHGGSAELASADGDWSNGGSFSFDAVSGDDVHLIRNGKVFAGERPATDTPAAPHLPASGSGSGGFGTRSRQHGHVPGEGGESRGGSGYGYSSADAFVDTLFIIDDIARAASYAGSGQEPAPEPSADPGSVSVPAPEAPSPSPSAGPVPSDVSGGSASPMGAADSSASSDSGGGCTGDSSGSSSGSSGSGSSGSDSSSCSGSSSGSSSTSDSSSSCGGSSSDSSSGGGCGGDSASSSGGSCSGGGGGCSGDAAASGSQRATKAASSTARLVWPIGLSLFINRRARAISKRRPPSR